MIKVLWMALTVAVVILVGWNFESIWVDYISETICFGIFMYLFLALASLESQTNSPTLRACFLVENKLLQRPTWAMRKGLEAVRRKHGVLGIEGSAHLGEDPLDEYPPPSPCPRPWPRIGYWLGSTNT